jgi:hypothetical protein
MPVSQPREAPRALRGPGLCLNGFISSSLSSPSPTSQSIPHLSPPSPTAMNLGDLLSHLFSPSQQLTPGHTNTRYGREPVAVSNLSLVDPDRPPATRLPTEPSAASGTIRVSPPSEPLQLMTPQLAARYMGSGSADLACFALQLYAQRRRSAARLARWLDTAYCDGLSPLVHRRSTLESLPSISVMHRQLCRPCSAALRSAAPPRRSPHSASRRSSDTTSKYGLYPFRKHRSTCQHDGSRRSEGLGRALTITYLSGVAAGPGPRASASTVVPPTGTGHTA